MKRNIIMVSIATCVVIGGIFLSITVLFTKDKDKKQLSFVNISEEQIVKEYGTIKVGDSINTVKEKLGNYVYTIDNKDNTTTYVWIAMDYGTHKTIKLVADKTNTIIAK